MSLVSIIYWQMLSSPEYFIDDILLIRVLALTLLELMNYFLMAFMKSLVVSQSKIEPRIFLITWDCMSNRLR